MFLAFALITLAGALGLLFARNLVVAGLLLVLTFLGVTGLFLLLANPVAAALQMIVYSGAIVVLLLFVIMLLAHHEEEAAQKERAFQRWVGAALALALGGGAFWLLKTSAVARELPKAAVQGPMTLHQVGTTLFGQHVVAFEAAGLLLLAAMVGAVILVKKEV